LDVPLNKTIEHEEGKKRRERNQFYCLDTNRFTGQPE